MDFYQSKKGVPKKVYRIYPDFRVCRSKDLMTVGEALRYGMKN